MRKILAALFLALSWSIAAAQAPGPVPALPDTARLTSYAITSSTCACSVGFALYGDGTDYTNWVQVFVNGVQQPANFTITSPSGSLATLPRPITDAVLTFTAPQTGTVQIVGARRPRRASQFTENRGVAARDLNQVITDITAENREAWDSGNRTIRGQPGELMNLLPAAATRAGGQLLFDGTGQPIVSPPAPFPAMGAVFTSVSNQASGSFIGNSFLNLTPTIVSTGTFAVTNEALRIIATRSGDITGGSGRLIDIQDVDNSVAGSGGQGKPITAFIYNNFRGANDGVTTLNVVTQNSAVTAPASSPGWYVGAAIDMTAAFGSGGVAGVGNQKGNWQGLNILAFSSSGATFLSTINGAEIDVGIAAGSSANAKVGLNIQSGNGAGGGSDFNHALTSFYDVALSIGATTVNDVGFNYGIVIGQQGFGWPISATGTIIAAQTTANARTAANGVDFSLVTFSQSAFKSNGFLVDGNGVVNGIGTVVTNPFAQSVWKDTQAGTAVTAGSLVRFQGRGANPDSWFFNINTAAGADFSTSVDAFGFTSAGVMKFGTSSFTANGAVATAMSGVGPVGSHTTIQKWFTVQDSTGAVFYIPAF